MAQLQSNGLTIEYDTFGDRGADPVLLIMGLGTQMTAWSPEFCESLVAHGHYVVRFDNRDIGLSTKFEGARAPGRLRYLMHRVFHTSLGAPHFSRTWPRTPWACSTRSTSTPRMSSAHRWAG